MTTPRIHPALPTLKEAADDNNLVTSDRVPVLAEVPLNDATDKLRALSWHVRQELDSYGTEDDHARAARYERIANDLLQMIDSQNPDVVTLQGILPSVDGHQGDEHQPSLFDIVLKALNSKLMASWCYIVSAEQNDRSKDCVTFYNSSVLALDNANQQPGAASEDTTLKGVSVSLVHSKTNKKVQIHNVRVTRLYPEPFALEEQIKNKFADADEDTVTVVVGDFNYNVYPLGLRQTASDEVAKSISTGVVFFPDAPEGFPEGFLGTCTVGCLYSGRRGDKPAIISAKLAHLNPNNGERYTDKELAECEGDGYGFYQQFLEVDVGAFKNTGHGAFVDNAAREEMMLALGRLRFELSSARIGAILRPIWTNRNEMGFAIYVPKEFEARFVKRYTDFVAALDDKTIADDLAVDKRLINPESGKYLVLYVPAERLGLFTSFIVTFNQVKVSQTAARPVDEQSLPNPRKTKPQKTNLQPPVLSASQGQQLLPPQEQEQPALPALAPQSLESLPPAPWSMTKKLLVGIAAGALFLLGGAGIVMLLAFFGGPLAAPVMNFVIAGLHGLGLNSLIAGFLTFGASAAVTGGLLGGVTAGVVSAAQEHRQQADNQQDFPRRLAISGVIGLVVGIVVCVAAIGFTGGLATPAVATLGLTVAALFGATTSSVGLGILAAGVMLLNTVLGLFASAAFNAATQQTNVLPASPAPQQQPVLPRLSNVGMSSAGINDVLNQGTVASVVVDTAASIAPVPAQPQRKASSGNGDARISTSRSGSFKVVRGLSPQDLDPSLPQVVVGGSFKANRG